MIITRTRKTLAGEIPPAQLFFKKEMLKRIRSYLPFFTFATRRICVCFSYSNGIDLRFFFGKRMPPPVPVSQESNKCLSAPFLFLNISKDRERYEFTFGMYRRARGPFFLS